MNRFLNIDIGSWIIKEERTRTYLDNIPLWSEEIIFEEDGDVREYLFTGGMEREEFLDMMEKDGYTLVYSPRHLIQKGHVFDLIFVKIGDKNITGIGEVWNVSSKNEDGSFTKLPDCINIEENRKEV